MNADVHHLFVRLSELVHTLPLRVATKFALTFMLCSFVAIGGYAVVIADREKIAIAENVERDLGNTGRVLASLASDVWMKEGEERARELLGTAEGDGLEVRLLDVPTPASSERRGDVATARFVIETPRGPRTLELTRPVPAFGRILSDEAVFSISTALTLAAVAAWLSYWLGHLLLAAPIARITAQARRIGEGDLSQRLTVQGSDEVASLKQELNVMCDQIREARERADAEARARIEAVEHLRHADRLKTVGTLAAGIAHELGTPLNIVLLRAKMIERSAAQVPESAVIPTGARAIRDATLRMTAIVRQLLDFARTKKSVGEAASEAEVGACMLRVEALLAPLARERGAVLTVDGSAEPVFARIRPGALEQVLTNLVMNAVDAVSYGAGAVRLRAFVRRFGTEEHVGIVVEDNGCGIPASLRERIFEPFFTTKEVGRGTGLGLAVAHGIVQEYGGEIVVESAEERGTTMLVLLPFIAAAIEEPRVHKAS